MGNDYDDTDIKKRLRRERSLAFFKDKKKGKYKRVKSITAVSPSLSSSLLSSSTDVRSNVLALHNNQIHTLKASSKQRNEQCKYYVNVIIAHYMFILADRFGRKYRTVNDFFDNIRNYFRGNVNIILYTNNPSEIEAAKAASCPFDLTISLDKYDKVIAHINENERPIKILRKCMAQKLSLPISLSGPFVLLTKSSNVDNNKQYDIIKDVRRYYKRDRNTFEENIEFEYLLEDIKESVENLYKI